MKTFVAAVMSFGLLWTGLAWAAEPAPSIVVIDFFLQDDMIPGPGGKAPGAADAARRTKMLRDYFVDKLARSENYRLLSLDRDGEAYRELLASHGRLFECKHCIANFGQSVSADYVLHGWVQRVSNLIINLNVEILDPGTGKIYDRATVDTRGNTDKSWLDGASYLQRHLQYGL